MDENNIQNERTNALLDLISSAYKVQGLKNALSVEQGNINDLIQKIESNMTSNMTDDEIASTNSIIQKVKDII